jgi:hypothetical protein
MANERRTAALELAETVLTDIELGQTDPPAILAKVTRLARFLDDTEALKWLQAEAEGWHLPLSSQDRTFALRSKRVVWGDSGEIVHIASLAAIESSRLNVSRVLESHGGESLGPKLRLTTAMSLNAEISARVVSALHQYASEKEVELRFGAAVESAFGLVRDTVDARIASLAPEAAVKFAAAFENASSDNSEHWANAAGVCRRLLQAVADKLQPASEPINGRPMTADKYVNRLIHFISQHQATGETYRDVISSDLEDLGKRIDAVAGAGHKGAHAEVTKYEASRFLTGTYLLVGDILVLADAADASFSKSGPATTAEKAPASE